MGKWVHRMLEIDTDSRTGVCVNCGAVPLTRKRGRLRCSKAVREQRGRPTAEARSRSKGSHGLSVDQARQFRAGKICAICGSGIWLCVDHDHATGRIRGVLCLNCNNGLGRFKDDPELLRKAIDYLA